MAAMSAGKLTNLMRLADAAGRFKMLAIDLRDPLREALARAAGRGADQVGYEEMAATKTLITEVLSPHATAILVDPVYGLPRALKAVPADVGLLAAIEEAAPERAGPGGKERRARLVDGWSIAQVKRAGLNAAKLLVHYTPEASAETLAHQQRLVRRVGEECGREDLPFLLELVTYPLAESSADTPEFARRRPEHTIASAVEFSRDEYRVDILKLEFPGDLKYAREYCAGAFDGRERPAVYTRAEVNEFVRRLDEAAGRPWVILSGGVEIAEFLANLELAAGAGASGFLCGRAIWKDAIPRYPDRDGMRAFLERDAVDNFRRANAVAESARPWFDHRWVGGWERIRMPEGEDSWYRTYAAAARAGG
ncbi:MAG TPA: tagatose 1,6-diphosphate aldolase [bacterium]|nr:tagatose 1,6-diphosphate aldolase [bacterium]